MNRFNRGLGIQVLVILIASGFLIGASGAKNPAKNTAPFHSVHFHTVGMKNMVYNPAKLTISVGDTVEWINSDNVPHMVNSDSSIVFQSPLFNPGKSFQYVFKTSGKFPYHCAIHPMMIGTIIVK
jgi:plastocyanin